VFTSRVRLQWRAAPTLHPNLLAHVFNFSQLRHVVGRLRGNELVTGPKEALNKSCAKVAGGIRLLRRKWGGSRRRGGRSATTRSSPGMLLGDPNSDISPFRCYTTTARTVHSRQARALFQVSFGVSLIYTAPYTHRAPTSTRLSGLKCLN
jgi:hypothetical protein